MNSLRQLPLKFRHRPAYGRDDFLVMSCNAAAIGWLDRWPDWPGAALCVWGAEGSGKTHLMNAWRSVSGARVVSVEELANLDRAELAGAAVAIENHAGGLPEIALFHLYNLLVETGGSLLLTGSEPPSHWQISLPDLRSRLLALPSVGIEAPDDSALGAVMAKLFHDRQIQVSEDVIWFLVSRIERSFAAVRHAVEELDRMALSQRRSVTIPLARQFVAGGSQKKA